MESLSFLFNMLKQVLDWTHDNKEGFWQGLFLSALVACLWGASKIVGKGKAMAGGVMDTYNRMAEDLQKRIDEERDDNAKRLATLKEELDEYRTKMASAEDKAQTEHEARMALYSQLATLREALAKSGVTVNPDGSVSIKGGV